MKGCQLVDNDAACEDCCSIALRKNSSILLLIFENRIVSARIVRKTLKIKGFYNIQIPTTDRRQMHNQLSIDEP